MGLFFILVICFIYGIFIYIHYNESVKRLLNESSDVFNNVIDTDQDIRLKEINIPMSFGIVPEDTVTQITFEREGHPPIYKERTDSIKQLSYTIKHNNMIQTVLFYENPINVNILDSLFQIKLHEKDIKAKTAIQYTNHTEYKTLYSNSDTLSYKDFFAFPKITLGVGNEMALQAFIRLSPITVVRNAGPAIGGITFIWAVLMSISIYFALKKEKIVAVTEQPRRSRIQITDNICLETDRNCLIYNQKEIELTELYTKFLSVLLHSPDYFAGYEELIQELYGNIEKRVGKERLSQLVKRIRVEVLTLVPEIELKNIPQKGYTILKSP